MTTGETIRDRLVQAVGEVEHVLEDTQVAHTQLVDLERRVTRLQFPDIERFEVEGDAIAHATALHAAHRRQAAVGPSALAAAEQVWEASKADYAWFDEVSAQFPGLDPTSLNPVWGADAASTGALALYRGFRGEQLVSELLANLDLPFPPGFEGFSFAETTNNPAWDLIIHTSAGDLKAQVKVSADAAVIRRHLDAHPEVSTVYASSDAADAARTIDGVVVIKAGDPWPTDLDASVVVDIGQTSAEIGADLTDALASQSDLLDEVIEFFPLTALALISGRAGYRLLDSDTPATDIGREACSAAKSVMVNSSVGELASILVAESVGAPVTLTMAVSRSLIAGVRGSVERSADAAHDRTEFLQQLQSTLT